jgi:hypothetical protein
MFPGCALRRGVLARVRGAPTTHRSGGSANCKNKFQNQRQAIPIFNSQFV